MSATSDADAHPLPPGVTVGRHTYGHVDGTFRLFMPGVRIDVGAFCSIAPEVRILAGSEHVMTRVTTFPLNALLFDPAGGNAIDAVDRGTTEIGHDVWLGLGAIVLSGVKIGHGAIVGAGSVVSKWVPPYAVVVGNPAQIVHYRFDSDMRHRLLTIRWWEWDDEQIHALRSLFMADVDSFLNEAEEIHGRRAEGDLDRRLREAPLELLTSHRGQLDRAGPGDPTEARSTESPWLRAERGANDRGGPLS
jgi:acetyltransferase-like isoleucine patch superfamily enzyme